MTVDKKLARLSYSLFMQYAMTGKAEHKHNTYALYVTSYKNTVSFKVTKKQYSNGKPFEVQIQYMTDTCNPNCRVYTQHDTLFEVSTVNTIYKYLYIMYHRKVKASELTVDLSLHGSTI